MAVRPLLGRAGCGSGSVRCIVVEYDAVGCGAATGELGIAQDTTTRLQTQMFSGGRAGRRDSTLVCFFFSSHRWSSNLFWLCFCAPRWRAQNERRYPQLYAAVGVGKVMVGIGACIIFLFSTSIQIGAAPGTRSGRRTVEHVEHHRDFNDSA